MERRSDHGPGALSGSRGLDLCAASGVLCTTILAASPFLLSATPAALRPAPCLGQHNAYVYGALLGMNAVAMARYTAEGIFY